MSETTEIDPIGIDYPIVNHAYSIYISYSDKETGMAIGVIHRESNKHKCPQCNIDTTEDSKKIDFDLQLQGITCNNIEFKSTGKLYCLPCIVDKLNELAADNLFLPYELV